jgi:AcrR family transcriptional regulator
MGREAVGGRVRRRGGLTQQDVVAAAAVVAERGVSKLTMSAVAAELGVTAMALYQHVDDKEHLLTLLMDSLLVEIEVPPPSVGPWDVRLRRLHTEVTAAMTRYPGLVSIAGEAEQVPRLLDGYLDLMLAAGFGERAAALTYTGLYYLAMGAQHPWRDIVPTPAALPPADPVTHDASARVAAAVRGVTVDELQHFTFEVYLEGLRHLRATIGQSQS